jgi:hypothetical protein
MWTYLIFSRTLPYTYTYTHTHTHTLPGVPGECSGHRHQRQLIHSPFKATCDCQHTHQCQHTQQQQQQQTHTRGCKRGGHRGAARVWTACVCVWEGGCESVFSDSICRNLTSLSHALSHTRAHTHSLTHTYTLSLSHTLNHNAQHSPTHTHTHTHTLAVRAPVAAQKMMGSSLVQVWAKTNSSTTGV